MQALKKLFPVCPAQGCRMQDLEGFTSLISASAAVILSCAAFVSALAFDSASAALFAADSACQSI